MFSITINQKEFTDSIPFISSSDLQFVKVLVNGKSYTFLFDSGAPTTISESLCKTLQLKPVFTEQVSDATGVNEDKSFFSIDSLSIGQVTYSKIGVLSTSLKALSESVCMQIDGIIGNNIMRTCNWKINYTNNLIYLSDRSFPETNVNDYALTFKESIEGAPFVNMQLGKFNFWVEWDSGNNGFTTLVDTLILKNAQNHINKIAKGNGMVSQGVLGIETDSNAIVAVDTLLLNHQSFSNEILTTGYSNLIGQRFMKRFHQIILNWKTDKKIYLIGNPQNYSERVTTTYGFDPHYLNGKVQVVYVWDDSRVQNMGIKIGDVITTLNGKDISHITNEDWCNIKTEIHNSDNPISIIIPNRNNGQPMTFERNNLFK